MMHVEPATSLYYRCKDGRCSSLRSLIETCVSSESPLPGARALWVSSSSIVGGALLMELGSPLRPQAVPKRFPSSSARQAPGCRQWKLCTEDLPLDRFPFRARYNTMVLSLYIAAFVYINSTMTWRSTSQQLEDANPFPLFQATRWTLTSQGHAPVLERKLGSSLIWIFLSLSESGRTIKKLLKIRFYLMRWSKGIETGDKKRSSIIEAYDIPWYSDYNPFERFCIP